MDVSARTKELEDLYLSEDGGWRAIKALADPHKIEKPEGGWDEAIPLIVAAEAKAEQLPDENPQVEQAETSTLSKPNPSDTPWRKPRTDLYGNLIPNPWSSY
jgi:hypothetical protein